MSDQKPITIEQRRARRRAFLERLYDIVEGDPGSIVDFIELGKEMNLDHAASWDVRSFLGREEVISGVTSTGISITHKGARLVERWRVGPDGDFGGDEEDPNEVHNYGDVHITAANAQVQQGAKNSSQHMTVTDQTVSEIKSFMKELSDELDTLRDAGLPEDAADEVNAQALTAQGQLASKTPKWDVIKHALDEIKTTLEAVKEIGSTVAPWVARAATLLGMLP